MATWTFPKATTSEYESGGSVIVTLAEGQVFYDTDKDAVIVATGTSTYIELRPADLTSLMLSGTDAVVRTASDGTLTTGTISNTDVADDAAITLSKLESGSENQYVGVDSDGNVAFITVDGGTILSRDVGGNLTSQKLKSSMVEDGTLPYNKLEDIPPGHLLGALETGETDNVAVSPVSIADITGATITSSDMPPEDPRDNDLWYYNGERAGDNARLYLYQNGIWVDASPPIVNTDPGIQGEPGEDGMDGIDGKSVVSMRSEIRTTMEDVYIEFFNDTEQNFDTLVGDLTIKFSDITFDSNVPAADNLTDGNYVLAADNFQYSWKPAETGALSRKIWTAPVSQSNPSDDVVLSVSDFTDGTSGTNPTEISGAHIVTFAGFVLQERIGSAGGDYTVAADGQSITILASAAVHISGDSLELINFTLS